MLRTAPITSPGSSESISLDTYVSSKHVLGQLLHRGDHLQHHPFLTSYHHHHLSSSHKSLCSHCALPQDGILSTPNHLLHWPGFIHFSSPLLLRSILLSFHFHQRAFLWNSRSSLLLLLALHFYASCHWLLLIHNHQNSKKTANV